MKHTIAIVAAILAACAALIICVVLVARNQPRDPQFPDRVVIRSLMAHFNPGSQVTISKELGLYQGLRQDSQYDLLSVWIAEDAGRVKQVRLSCTENHRSDFFQELKPLGGADLAKKLDSLKGEKRPSDFEVDGWRLIYGGEKGDPVLDMRRL